MDDQPIPVKSKRRRRWLISAAVLLVLIVVGWIFRPHTDPRFVGKWLERAGEPNEAEWTFKEDGTLELYAITQRTGTRVTLPYQWFIFRGRFYHTPAPDNVGHAMSSMAEHVWRVLRKQAATPNVVIEEVTPTSIVLRPVVPGPRDDAQLIRLKRAPSD